MYLRFVDKIKILKKCIKTIQAHNFELKVIRTKMDSKDHTEHRKLYIKSIVME